MAECTKYGQITVDTSASHDEYDEMALSVFNAAKQKIIAIIYHVPVFHSNL